MAFANLGNDNVSDQRISFYSTVCLALEDSNIDEQLLEAYLANTPLSKIRNDYLDKKRSEPGDDELNSFKVERATFRKKYKKAKVPAYSLQLVLGYTDGNGDFISSVVVEDKDKAEFFVKDAIKPPKPEPNPFLPLFKFYKGLNLPFGKKQTVFLQFKNANNGVLMKAYSTDDKAVVEAEGDESIVACIPKGKTKIRADLLNHLILLKGMCNHDDVAT